MKKFRLLLGIVCALLLCVLCLASCGSKLEAPTGLRLDTDTLVLSWDKNSEANGYSILIGEKEKVTRATSYPLSELAEGEHVIKVKALGDGRNTTDSEYAVYTFEKDPETGLIYRLINDNTEYELIGSGGAAGDVVMEVKFRKKFVTSIADAAIANNSKITSFKINENIKTIPKKMFYNCSALVSVDIPASVTSIGENAFQSCHSLTSITIPSGVKELRPYTFAYCRTLGEVKGGEGLELIDSFAFAECSSLPSFTVPTGVKTIGNYAFSGCKTMTAIKLNRGLENIGDYAFYSCTGFASINLEEGLLSIGASAFESCRALTALALPNSLSTIGNNAFAFCENLATVTGGNDVDAIGNNVLQGTAYYNNYPEDIVYLGKWILACKDKKISTGKDITNLIDPETVGVADFAFAACTGFTGITLPNVRYIGYAAFNACTSLMDVRLGESATYIGDGAFAACTILRNVYINTSKITYIGDSAFQGCKRLSKLDLPDTVEYIGAKAFKDTAFTPAVDGVIYVDNWAVGTKSQFINNVVIKDKTVGISEYAFMECILIATVDMPKSLNRICKGAFLLCTNIFIDQLPQNLTKIDDYAFYGCENIILEYSQNNTVFPNSLESIGKSAFYGSSVQGVTIPGSCKTIGDYAFFGCAKLGAPVTQENVDQDTGNVIPTTTNHPLILEEGIEKIGSRAFYGCSGLETVRIPDSVTEMGIRTFYQCAALKKVELGAGLTSIPDFAFYECGALTEVVIPDNCERIGKSAFYNCVSLETVKLGRKVAEIDQFAFRGCTSLTQIIANNGLATIGNYAFRGATNITYVLLNKDVTDVRMHAFYGALNATIYCEGNAPGTSWNERWNSSFRPVIWGCELSGDGSYVVSFVKTADSIENFDAINGISAPMREGYTFAGWATVKDGTPVYTAAEVMNAPDGTTLYAVWQ